MTKIIDLSAKCGDDMKNLEKLHYETVTKERIVALSLSMTDSPSSLLDEYKKDYFDTFVNYEKAKDEFYEKYIIENNPDNYPYWEINFRTGGLILHD